VRNRNKEFEIAFGKNVRRLREERGWSQEQLAAVADIEPTQVSRIETSKHAANLHTILAIAVALGKYPHELLQFDFEVELNTDVELHGIKKKGPKTTEIVVKIAETSFLNSPRSVDEIITHCKKVYHVQLKSPATSAILKKLTDEKKLARLPSQIKGRFLYKKRRK
jgi:transcriptional regulator with XRE-family HTH domain